MNRPRIQQQVKFKYGKSADTGPMVEFVNDSEIIHVLEQGHYQDGREFMRIEMILPKGMK